MKQNEEYLYPLYSESPYVSILSHLLYYFSSPICILFFFFLNHLGVNCRHDAHLPLNSSVCISQNTGTFNFRIVIKFRKSTLLRCYLIYRLYLTSSCPDNVLYSKRKKKNGFLALICDVNCRRFLLVCHLTLFIVIFFFFANLLFLNFYVFIYSCV